MIGEVLTSILVLGTCGVVLSILIVAFDAFFGSKAQSDDLLRAVDDLLPQTQCAQCGYPGCTPYAEAVLRGESLGLCIPGGEQTRKELASLLNRPLDDQKLDEAVVLTARIRESECIGCTLCTAACPVDAIVGAPQFLHAILESHCTGCELCVPPCPVDCIELVRPT